METSWNVYDYPVPPEDEKTVKGEITVTYKIEVEVPKDWDEEEIRNYLQDNTGDYLDQFGIDEIVDLDFYEVSR